MSYLKKKKKPAQSTDYYWHSQLTTTGTCYIYFSALAKAVEFLILNLDRGITTTFIYLKFHIKFSGLKY